jgi:hypothetical protein
MNKAQAIIIFILAAFWAVVAGFITSLYTPDVSIIVALAGITAAFVILVSVMVVALANAASWGEPKNE